MDIHIGLRESGRNHGPPNNHDGRLLRVQRTLAETVEGLMIAKDGTIELKADVIEILEHTNPLDRLLIYDDIETDLYTVGDFIARVQAIDEPLRFPGWNVAIGHKTWGSKEMEVLISKSR